MNGIMVMADLLVNADLPRRLHRYADVIATSGRSLLAIINDILDFSKIEAGKLELEQGHIVLDEIVENVTSLFAERAASQSIDLAARDRPGRSAHDVRGSGSPEPGSWQSRQQRPEIHDVWFRQAHDRQVSRRSRHDRVVGRGYRHRNPRGQAVDHLRIVFAGRPVDNPQVRRYRPRLGDLPAHRHRHGRRHRRLQHGRLRFDVSGPRADRRDNRAAVAGAGFGCVGTAGLLDRPRGRSDCGSARNLSAGVRLCRGARNGRHADRGLPVRRHGLRRYRPTGQASAALGVLLRGGACAVWRWAGRCRGCEWRGRRRDQPSAVAVGDRGTVAQNRGRRSERSRSDPSDSRPRVRCQNSPT